MEILENFKLCKKGDKLLVRESLNLYVDDFPHSIDDSGIMRSFENKTVTIKNINKKCEHPYITLEEDKNLFHWDPKMFYNPIQYNKYWE